MDKFFNNKSLKEKNWIYDGYAQTTNYIETFEKNAVSINNESKRRTYLTLIEDILWNIVDFDDELKIKVLDVLTRENDFGKLSAIYQITKELDENDLDDHSLAEDFYSENDIHHFSDVWYLMNEEVKAKGLDEIDQYLLQDLLEINGKADWVQINGYGRAYAIEDIEKEFNNWVISDLENLIKKSNYTLEDYLDHKEDKEDEKE
ncbi:hypothetical protein V2E25_01400 [Mycoplasmopsis arginini]|uniref:Uncharacterized protein n=1 Tax=Mycoplasmopsis arginini TaxID=2094 RepID=A0ABZ2ANA3_MYCAR|nr:hypothetical protein [Mycoplasmopsis arginini]WVN22237.1 hypothetical protein V2E25_01400 [Mycoplasmopsis arginini]VEU81644.1 Uncharacterised protein [Mycoplasmopsis arginini]